MTAGGPLEESCSARLLFAAAMMDLVFLLLLSRLIGPQAVQQIQAFIPGTPEPAHWAIFGFLLVLVYWLLVEFVFFGASLGRVSMGLALRDRTGQYLTTGRRASRCIRKVGLLGLGGLRLNHAATYDLSTESRWFSDMAPRAYRPIKSWKLIVASGRARGRTVTFGKLPGFNAKHGIKIGRDPAWSDFVLPQSENRVSSKHCLLLARADGLYIKDVGTQGKGSSNGTRLNGRRIAPGVWVPVGHAAHFYVAEVRIKIDR